MGVHSELTNCLRRLYGDNMPSYVQTVGVWSKGMHDGRRVAVLRGYRVPASLDGCLTQYVQHMEEVSERHPGTFHLPVCDVHVTVEFWHFPNNSLLEYRILETREEQP